MPVNSLPTALSRYARQEVLGITGREGQKNLARSTVLVLGCGALGSTQAELLARAGVGRLILVDRDVLEYHNLQRQSLYDEKDANERMPKAVAAVRRLRSINSEIEIDAVVTDFTATNIAELISPADLVLDGSDSLETRFRNDDFVHPERIGESLAEIRTV